MTWVAQFAEYRDARFAPVPRLRLAKEAAKYGLHSLSDELFNYPKCVIVSKMIAYNPRSTDRQGPPLARIKVCTA